MRLRQKLMKPPQPSRVRARAHERPGRPRLSGGLVLRTAVAWLGLAVGAGCRGAEPSPEENVPTHTGAPVEEDWPEFLGPRQNGASHETGLLETWPEEGLPLAWEHDAGAGYSAPSIRGKRLVLHHRVGGDEVVAGLDADDGHELWSINYRSRFTDPYGYNNGPRCSPLLTGTHCYTLGAEGCLLCVTLDRGEEIWRRDLRAQLEIPEGFFGVGASPILVDGKLIVAAGGQPNSGLLALDPATGETLWASVGKSTWDGAKTDSRLRPVYKWSGDEMLVSYSSPMAAQFHGRTHILALMRQGLVSVDPSDGAENFHYWFSSDVYESVNAARPVVVDDTILLSASYDVGAARLRVAPDGKSVTELWRDRRNLSTHWSTAIYHAGCYFGFSGRHSHEAELRCLDAGTGEIKWTATGWDRPATDLRQVSRDEVLDVVTERVIPIPFYGRGSKILVGDRFIVLSEYGTVALLAADSAGWHELARFKPPRMNYPSWAAPVLSHGRLYLRSEDALLCYDVRRAKP